MPKSNCQQRHAQWVERLERLADANLSVAEFCRREAVSVASFYAWKKRLPRASGAKTRAAKGGAAETKFLSLVVSTPTTPPITTTQPIAATPPILRLPGGAVIELSGQLGRRQLVDLIAAVVEATESSRIGSEETR